jgi:LysM repeat protein
VDRLCPYLALADDGRTVADGFDPEHRCHALTPPAPLDRARQVQLCLTEAHVRCERYGAARTAWLAASSGLPRVAPDVAFPRTRLVLEPEPAWRNLATPSARYSRRTVLVAAVAAVVVGLLVVSSLMGILGGAPGGASQTPLPSGSPIATPLATASTSPSVAASASAAASATTPATPAPSLRTYVVQQGDTLNLIAQQFGTTVAAIQAANGLTGTEINVGQVLIIP